MIELVLVDGRYRRVISKEPNADGFNATLVVGFREKNSSSAKSPGPGWRPVVGKPRSWFKREPRTETRFLRNDDFLSLEDWPIGMEKHGAKTSSYAEILTSVIASGVESSGAMGLRKPPELRVETVEGPIKDAGLPMPTEDEFVAVVLAIWEQNHRPTKRAPVTGSPVVVGRSHRRTPPPDVKG